MRGPTSGKKPRGSGDSGIVSLLCFPRNNLQNRAHHLHYWDPDLVLSQRPHRSPARIPSGSGLPEKIGFGVGELGALASSGAQWLLAQPRRLMAERAVRAVAYRTWCGFAIETSVCRLAQKTYALLVLHTTFETAWRLACRCTQANEQARRAYDAQEMIIAEFADSA